MTRSRRRKLEREQAAKRASAARPTRPSLIIALPFAPMLFTGGAARAQDPAAPAPPPGIEEITVTSQKREESLQDVPISVQALSDEKLEELQINSFDDYIKYLPSVNYQTLAPGFGLAYFRGIANGENNNHSGPYPTVGIYLDEMPITTIQGALDLHLYDIARVEALAGPQGTLYGASSMAGTIRIITKKPDPTEFAAGYDLEVNSVSRGGIGYVGEGFVNQPISDFAALRLVGWYKKDAGFIDNVYGQRNFPTAGSCLNNSRHTRRGCGDSPATTEDDYNETETYGGRAALGVDLTENWTITPSVMAQVTNYDGGPAFDADRGDLHLSRYYPEEIRDRFWQAALTIEGQIANFDVTYAGGYLDRYDTVDADYSDYAYFYDVLYGYASYWADSSGNPLPDPSQYIHGRDDYDRIFHELRVATPAEERLRAIVGVFYESTHHEIYQRYRIDDLGVYEVTGWDDTIWLTNQERKHTEFAGFGEASLDITDQLTLTGGLRAYRSYDAIKGFFGFNDAYSSNYGEALCFSTEQFRGSPCTNLDDSVDETGVVYKGNLTYNFDDERLIYLTYSEGYRPAGINRNATVGPYSSDTLKNYEFGWKTSWRDGTVRVNGAAFVETWDDMQFSFLPPSGSGLTVIDNAGRGRILGLELFFDWFPTDRLQLGGGFTVIDAELRTDYRQSDIVSVPGSPPPTGPPDASEGDELPVTPEFKGNLIARYTMPIGSWTGFVQSASVYQTSSWSDLLAEDRRLIGSNDPFFTTDLSFGLERETYGVELYVNNVFDERAEIFKFTGCSTEVCANPGNGSVYTVPTQPRTIGLKFHQRF
jgi:outer membrane receptor protein involved in Fe transport